MPAAPAGLEAQRAGGSVRRSWERVPGTSSYTIWRRPAPDASLEYVGGYPTATTETFVDDVADPDQSVTYVVRAVNAMKGTEGRAAMVTYEPGAAGPSSDDGPSVLPGGLPATLIGGIAVVVVVLVGAGLYLRRRSG